LAEGRKKPWERRVGKTSHERLQMTFQSSIIIEQGITQKKLEE